MWEWTGEPPSEPVHSLHSDPKRVGYEAIRCVPRVHLPRCFGGRAGTLTSGSHINKTHEPAGRDAEWGKTFPIRRSGMRCDATEAA